MTPPPTRRQQRILQGMVLLGLAGMSYFLYRVYRADNHGDPWLYWLLVGVLTYGALKTLHEWIHYLAISGPPKVRGKRAFTADVFTTFCAGEPYEMIVETLTAIKNIRYPHESYLCDEADDPYLRQVCQELGIHHVTRTKKIHAKAGNINNALRQSTGEICLILDPDHVPEPDFLDKVIPQFEDESVGFVQVVQTYKNEKESLIARGAAQQTYQFYGPMMMSMGRYGTAQAIGANCTFRRAALESIGGHAPGLAEDMHTSMKLHAEGWRSVYVPQIVARGLVPSTLSAYYKQQLKWSRGVFDLLVHELPKIFRQLTLPQKLHYAILPGFYLGGLAYLLNFLIPILAIFLNRMPFQIDLVEFLLIGTPYFASRVLIRQYSQHWVMEEKERGLHIIGGLLLIGTWWIHSLGFLFTLFNVRIKYDPTPKDGNEANNWPLNIPNLIVIALSLSAGGYSLVAYPDNPLIYMMASLAFLNSAILTFTVVASRQAQYLKWIRASAWRRSWYQRVYEARKRFWQLNRRSLGTVRLVSLLLLLGIGAGSVTLLFQQESFRLPIIAAPGLKARLHELSHQPISAREITEAEAFAFPGKQQILTQGKGSRSRTFEILVPAKVLYPGSEVTYSLLERRGDTWELVGEQDTLLVEWNLLVEPESSDLIRMGSIGQGPQVTLDAPRYFDAYRIVAIVRNQHQEWFLKKQLRHPLEVTHIQDLANL